MHSSRMCTDHLLNMPESASVGGRVSAPGGGSALGECLLLGGLLLDGVLLLGRSARGRFAIGMH